MPKFLVCHLKYYISHLSYQLFYHHCTVDNIGSNKTILSLGGELEKTEFDNYDNTMTNYYWINVNDAIEKNYERYKNYIKFDSKIKK